MNNTESESEEDEIFILDEDRCDYLELYDSVREIVYNFFAEKGILNEMEYYHFFEYIRGFLINFFI